MKRRARNNEITATIAVGQTQSAEINLDFEDMIGLWVPAAFSGTEITFLAKPNAGASYVPVYTDDGNELALTVPAATACFIAMRNLSPLFQFQFVKLVSGTTQATNDAVFRIATGNI